ncbi:MAG: hypothetical protein HY094_06725 [Candidatus Melainabacteria bacterium]|nr:hypothetical protein [Candidatus Melainabacteria bacterium]
MKTIWFCGDNEDMLTSTAEIVGEELINREQYVELVVQSEVQEILGRGLKDTEADRSTFADRLGFLGNLLHRNKIFALIISKDATLNDRKKIKETYGNYIQVNLGDKDSLCDLVLDTKDDSKTNAKKIIEHLAKEKSIPEQCTTVYSKDEEEEIRRRLEELGYV